MTPEQVNTNVDYLRSITYDLPITVESVFGTEKNYIRIAHREIEELSIHLYTGREVETFVETYYLCYGTWYRPVEVVG